MTFESCARKDHTLVWWENLEVIMNMLGNAVLLVSSLPLNESISEAELLEETH